MLLDPYNETINTLRCLLGSCPMPVAGLLEPSASRVASPGAAGGLRRLEAAPVPLLAAIAAVEACQKRAAGCVCVFISPLLFVGPPLCRWDGVGHLQRSLLVLGSVAHGTALGQLVPLPPGSGCAYTPRYVVDGAGLTGPGHHDGVGSCLVSRPRRLGIPPQCCHAVQNPFGTAARAGRRRRHLQACQARVRKARVGRRCETRVSGATAALLPSVDLHSAHPLPSALDNLMVPLHCLTPRLPRSGFGLRGRKPERQSLDFLSSSFTDSCLFHFSLFCLLMVACCSCLLNAQLQKASLSL